MREEQFSWSGLLALLVAGVLTALYLAPGITPFTISVGALGVTGALLAWRNLTLRTLRQPGVVVFARQPWVFLLCALLYALVGIALSLIEPYPHDAVWGVALASFLTAVAAISFAPVAFIAWGAEEHGLTRSVLGFSKTLAWSDIDWIYGAKKDVSFTAYEVIPVTKWRETTLIVEAGARRKITIAVRAPLAQGNAQPLIDAVIHHATGAQVGYDKLPQVDAQRRTPRQQGGGEIAYTTLPEAIATARQGINAQGCTLFPARSQALALNGITGVGIAALLAIGAVYARAQHISLVLSIFSIQTAPATRDNIATGELVALALGAFWLVVVGARSLRALGAVDQYFLLITPDAFAEVKAQHVTSARFADVRSFTRSAGLFGPQITAKLRQGKEIAIEANQYGPVRDLHGYLVASLSASAPPRVSAGVGAMLRIDGDAGI